MGTSNPRIAGYLQPHLFEAFQKYCSERGLKSTSEGLNCILEEHFRESENLENLENFPSVEKLTEAVAYSLSIEYTPQIKLLEKRILILETLLDTLTYSMRKIESNLLGRNGDSPNDSDSPSKQSEPSVSY